KAAFDQPLDDLLTFRDEQARLPREIPLVQLAIWRQPRIIDCAERNKHGTSMGSGVFVEKQSPTWLAYPRQRLPTPSQAAYASARIGTICVWIGPPVT